MNPVNLFKILCSIINLFLSMAELIISETFQFVTYFRYVNCYNARSFENEKLEHNPFYACWKKR